ncbi:hypothetical protein M8818_001960 [Zalaria obscura]|uniref:Uncharacterized protein n=1 Tax=Zalaria obscura TaxID=2024903 RepID=A0ACC3SJ60_9PEZI
MITAISNGKRGEKGHQLAPTLPEARRPVLAPPPLFRQGHGRELISRRVEDGRSALAGLDTLQGQTGNCTIASSPRLIHFRTVVAVFNPSPFRLSPVSIATFRNATFSIVPETRLERGFGPSSE